LLQLLLEHCDFLSIDFSQGSVATYLRCGGIFKYAFISNLPLSFVSKNFIFENRLTFGEVMGKSCLVFLLTVYLYKCYIAAADRCCCYQLHDTIVIIPCPKQQSEMYTVACKMKTSKNGLRVFFISILHKQETTAKRQNSIVSQWGRCDGIACDWPYASTAAAD